MIVVRTVLQAKFGTAGRLAASLTQASSAMMAEAGAPRRWRVLTDLSGPFDTVVQEVEAESLAEWEAMRARLFESSAFRESMAAMRESIVSGRNELWTIEGQG
jgi:hypothetical protein